ncbi:MAG: preprotein translocase subunit YajC [Verrucomicrobiales bacterium]|nr:preprotein translocase subunit YajC [Verrucomicrobiales bacterium]
MTLFNSILIAEAAGPSALSTFLPMFAIMGIFYFLLIRPQQQMRKKQELMRSKLAKNDKVITESGIHGIITGVTDKTVSIKVAEGVSMKFERFAIAQVLSESKTSED